MSEDIRETLEDNYPSNSKTTKPQREPEADDIPKKKKVEKVITGKVVTQKRGLGKKIRDNLIEEDGNSVLDYILHDVLIHAAKTMICEAVGWGGIAEMLLFGDKKGSRVRRENGRNVITNYNGVVHKSSLTRDTRDTRREMSRTGRARHNFDEIVLETRGEAEEVLSHLVDLTLDYGMASVADLYDLVDIPSNFTDNNFGWTDLRNASVSRVRGGYLINLPRVQALD